MKLEQLVNSAPALKNLLAVKLPVKIGYKISKLITKIQPELDIYEKQRNGLIRDLGEQIEIETDKWQVKPENLPKFSEEMGKLLSIEVSIEPFPGMPLERVKVEELGDVQLETNDLIALDWLLE